MKYIMVFIFFVSCNSSIKREHSLIIYDISQLNSVEKVKLSDIGVGDIEYYPLITTDSIFLSSIWDLKQDNNNVFICDEKFEIFRFKNDGKFTNKIGNKGKGPEEYLFPQDFSLDTANNRIGVLSTSENKIYFYSYNGEFIKSINIPTKTFFIHCLEKKILCCRLNIDGTIKNNFIEIDYEGNILHNYPNKYNYEKVTFIHAYLNELVSYGYNNQIYFKEIFSDTIFVYENYGFIPVYLLDYGINPITTKKRENITNFTDFINSSKNFLFQRKIFEFDRILYSEFTYKGNHFSYIRIKDGKGSFLSKKEYGYINDIDGGPAIWIKGNKDCNTFISWVDAYYLKSYVASEAFKSSTPLYPEKKKELEQLAGSLDENDNPVLMFVKLKE